MTRIYPVTLMYVKNKCYRVANVALFFQHHPFGHFSLAVVKDESRYIIICNSVFTQLVTGSSTLPPPAAQ